MASGRRINPGKPTPRTWRLRDVLRLLSKVAEREPWAFDPAHPDVLTPCWDWLGGTDGDGYGFVKLRGCKRWAHRVLYEVFRGPLADGMQVDHVCFNTGCVNPEHLRPATVAFNAGRKRPKPEKRKRRKRRELVKAGGSDDVAPF